MIGRVNIIQIQSEFGKVEAEYEDYIEEHPGVSNRNFYKSRLRRIPYVTRDRYR